MASSGNFATLNPLVKYSTGTFSNGNLTYASGSDDGYTSTIGLNFKSYCEVRVDVISNDGGTIGFRGATDEDEYFDVVSFQENYQSGKIYHYKGNSSQSVSTADIGGTVSAGNIIMMAYDPATYKWWVGVNGTWRNSGDPANGTGFVFQGSATMFENMGSIHWGAWNGTYTHTITFNFGQDSTFGGQETAGGNADGNGFGDFKYSVPTGFLATCSGNMVISDDIDPAQTDTDYPAKNFNVVTWTGNRTDDRAITGVGFAPDLVWIKQRASFGNPNILTDTVRGATKRIESNADIAEGTDSDGLKSFTSDGFTLGTNDKYNWDPPHTYLAWCWKGGGTPTATNSASAGATPTSGSVKIDGSNLGSALAGSIPATKLSANTKGGFSIITYTGTGSNATIAHGLSAKPDFILTKRLNSSQTWGVYHSGLGATKYLALNSTAVAGTSSSFWQDTEPTTSVISLGTEGRVNGNSQTYVAYAWHNVEGMQKFGTFIGNNTDNDGPFCYLGFRPRLLAIKGATEAYSWFVFDSARNTHNLVDKHLRWDSNDTEATESTGARKVDFLSNGFKVMADEASLNGSGDTYVYMAWGDVPFKYNNTF